MGGRMTLQFPISFLIAERTQRLMEAQWEWNPFFYQLSTVYELIFIFYYGTIERTDGSAMEVKPIFIGFPWYLNWSSSSSLFIGCQADWWKRNGCETHFYHLFMVYDLVFIISFLSDVRQTDGNAMGVKLIFIYFSWWIPWSSSLNKELANWQKDRSMRAAHIFLRIHSDYLFPMSWWWDNSDLFFFLWTSS
jgi:hypothetical protein